MAKKRKGKCTPELTMKVCILILQGMSFTKIAEVVDISQKTITQRWMNLDSKLYEPQFTDAVKSAQEELKCNGIKNNQFIEANRHKLKKVTRELRKFDNRTLKSKKRMPPPPMPPAYFNRNRIIAYAYQYLDLELDKTFTVDEMRMECRKRIYELTVDVMVKVREDEQEVAANQAAVKNVLTNTGNKDERWDFKQEMDIDVTENLLSDGDCDDIRELLKRNLEK